MEIYILLIMAHMVVGILAGAATAGLGYFAISPDEENPKGFIISTVIGGILGLGLGFMAWRNSPDISLVLSNSPMPTDKT